jgi:protein-disulfide isomerase/cyclophilin family peptidyl-prolyl cis-trans isomerase
MYKRCSLLVKILGVLLTILAACAPVPSPELPLDTEVPTLAPPTQTPEAKATSTPEATLPPTEAPSDTSDEEEAEGELVVAPPEQPGFCETMEVRPVDETDWVKGTDPENADITLFEYSDFQCPACKAVEPMLDMLLEEYPNVRLVYRHFPLNIHDKAMITSEAAEAAGAQGKFWEMHNLLFARKEEWESLALDAMPEQLNAYAEELGLDVEQFDQDMEQDTYLDKIQAQYQESIQLGLRGTPSFLFNDVQYPGGLSYEGLVAFMEVVPRLEAQFVDPPDTTLDMEALYQATLHTSKGEITFEFLNESAPTHINNFLYLAGQGWYDNANFFFVQDNYVAVTGDPTNTSVGYPGYYCYGEMQGVFDRDGLVGMLPNGQFFITLGEEANQLSGNFALIGQVVEGLAIAKTINNQGTPESEDLEPDVLEQVEIVTK